MKPWPRKGACFFVFLVILSTAPCFAGSDLLVYPTHIVLTDRQRTAQVDLINGGQTQASYKLVLGRKRMTEEGAFQNISTPMPGEKFADDLVRFSPRQVTLVPGGGQTVRMLFKLPQNLEEGEYRSHLIITKLPSGIKELPVKEEKDPKAFSMSITATVSVSIPVIVRHGKLDVKAWIDPQSVKVIKADHKKQEIEFKINRSGTRSIFGDIVVYKGGDRVAVGNGFSVYTPNNVRKIELRVLEPHLLKPGDQVKIVFTERDEKKPLAETTTLLR